MHPLGSISTSAIHFIISKMVSAVRADGMPQKCPPPDTKPPAPTVYPLQAAKWIQILEKYFRKTIFFTSTTTRKIR